MTPGAADDHSMKEKIGFGALAIIAAVLFVYFVLAKRPIPADAGIIATKENAVSVPATKVPVSTTATTSVERTELPEAPPKLSAANEAEIRSAQIATSIDSYYGKAMQGLGLNPEEVKTLRDFLITKAEVGYLAQEVVADTTGGTGPDVQNSARSAKAEIDEEIRKHFGDEKAARIQSMQEGVAYFGLEKRDLAPALEKAGVPQLSPVQLLKFAAAMAETNGKGINVIRPTRTDPATGLTDRDVPVLDKSLEFLSPEQVAVLKTVLVQRNRTP